jgi:hypothetical protein
MLLLGYSADKPSFSFNKSLKLAIIDAAVIAVRGCLLQLIVCRGFYFVGGWGGGEVFIPSPTNLRRDINEATLPSTNLTCENTLSTSAVLSGNTAAVLIKCMLLLGYRADKPSFSFNKSLRHAMMLLS